MADRFRKRMDRVSGKGGVRGKCGCCGLGMSSKTAVRMWFNRELQNEIEEEIYERLFWNNTSVTTLDVGNLEKNNV